MRQELANDPQREQKGATTNILESAALLETEVFPVTPPHLSLRTPATFLSVRKSDSPPSALATRASTSATRVSEAAEEFTAA